MKISKVILSTVTAAALLSFTACGGDSGDDTSSPIIEDNNGNNDNNTTKPTVTKASEFTGDSKSGIETAFKAQTNVAYPSLTKETISGEITSNRTLTADKIWVIEGLVAVKGATLTIEPGTVVAGKYGTGASTSYLVIDKDAKIMAEGTAAQPIIFTSEKAVDGDAPAVGQWGGLTIIGTAANEQVKPYEVNEAFVADDSNLTGSSGVIKNVKVLNSGITMAEDKEINGISMVGVGSGTVVENITVDLSDDDGMELWGGTVNLTNVTISRCTDDHFDIDDGYAGTVTNLVINNTTGNAGIEMSGNTAATFDGFNITMTESGKEGGIFFKKDGIGGHFKNGTVSYMIDDNGYGAIHSQGTFDSANTSFSNASIFIK